MHDGRQRRPVARYQFFDMLGPDLDVRNQFSSPSGAKAGRAGRSLIGFGPYAVFFGRPAGAGLSLRTGQAASSMASTAVSASSIGSIPARPRMLVTAPV